MGGHCNVTGIAGVGTKSSLLTILLAQTLSALAQHTASGVSAMQARAVILNVKGFDLFWVDHWSNSFTPADAAMWEVMGQPAPSPWMSPSTSRKHPAASTTRSLPAPAGAPPTPAPLLTSSAVTC